MQDRREPDFELLNEGTVVMLFPVTDAAKDWVEEEVETEDNWMGEPLVIESGYIGPIIEGLVEDGLTIALAERG